MNENTALIKALKTEGVRMSCNDRWMVWDETLQMWVVYGRKKHQQNTRTLTQTPFAELATPILTGKTEVEY